MAPNEVFIPLMNVWTLGGAVLGTVSDVIA